jgi:hypothetical protein
MSHAELKDVTPVKVKDIPDVIVTSIEPSFARPFIALMETLQETGATDSKGNILKKVKARHPGDEVDAGLVDVMFYTRS